MRVKFLSWIVVFFVLISSVYALNITSPINNSNIVRSLNLTLGNYTSSQNQLFELKIINNATNTIYYNKNFSYVQYFNFTGTIQDSNIYLNSSSNNFNGLVNYINITACSSSGTPIYPITFRYEDGTSSLVNVGISGTNCGSSIFGKFTWTNPYPNKIVNYIDIGNPSGSIAEQITEVYMLPLSNININLIDLNLPIGLYQINLTKKLSNWNYYHTGAFASAYSVQFNQSTFENSTLFFNLTANALLNVSVFSQATSLPISFTSNLSNNVSYAYASVVYDVTNGNNYSLYINSSNYNPSSSNYTVSSFGTTYLTKYLSAYNSVNITIRSESTNSIIYSSPNTSLSIVSDSGIVTYTTVNGSITLSGLTTDYYTFTFDKSGYNSRQYYINIADGSFQSLNVYLNNGTDILFNFKTSVGNALPDVIFEIYTVVNGTSVLVESVKSDITGKAQVSLESGKPYTFLAYKSGYNNYSFTLNPVLFTSYDVVLTASSSGSLVVPSASVSFSPTRFFRFQNVNFEIEFISPYNSLSSYGYRVLANGVNVSNSGSDSHGQRFTNYFTLNNVSNGDVVVISYYYNLSNGVNVNSSYSYPIVYTYSNRTWTTMGNSINTTTNQDSITGYYVGERIIIVTFITIVIFGVGWLIGGGITGFIFAIVPILFFINAGFVPKQIYYITFTFILFYIIGRGTDS